MAHLILNANLHEVVIHFNIIPIFELGRLNVSLTSRPSDGELHKHFSSDIRRKYNPSRTPQFDQTFNSNFFYFLKKQWK
jgi:hypothetical protein